MRNSFKRLFRIFCLTLAIGLAGCMSTGCVTAFIVSPIVNALDNREHFEVAPGGSDQYRFDMRVRHREISGIMYVQNVDNSGVKVVGTTYYGDSLFDVTVYPTESSFDSCIDFLDKPKVKSYIVRNIREQILPRHLKLYSI
jgi:hypothetical protein